jgi:CobQ-like glutamine amidotransferase family enzyme
MSYVSVHTANPEAFARSLRIAHLYGDLMNTYGDNGNVLMLKYVAEKLGASVSVEIVTLGDTFNSDGYDVVFWGGGQDYEQGIISEHLGDVTDGLRKFIEDDGPMLAICGGFQMLGQSFIDGTGRSLDCAKILPHHTSYNGDSRLIGDVVIHNEEFGETYYGFENHGARTQLGDGQKPLGRVVAGSGNNGEDQSEGFHYKNTFGSYMHGPLLSRNVRIAYRLISTALRRKYGEDVEIPAFEDVLGDEDQGAVTDMKAKAAVA